MEKTWEAAVQCEAEIRVELPAAEKSVSWGEVGVYRDGGGEWG